MSKLEEMIQKMILSHMCNIAMGLGSLISHGMVHVTFDMWRRLLSSECSLLQIGGAFQILCVY